MFFQDPEQALVRQPGHRLYDDPVPVEAVAKDTWEFALLSARIYGRDWDVASRVSHDVPELERWTLSSTFISARFRASARASGLFVEVWRRPPPDETVAVVFKGTSFFSWRDWRSNLRWFLRWLPWYRDQYTVLCEEFVHEFAAWVAQTCGSDARLVATGHSLGGGLAQQFAYALPSLRSRDGRELRLTYVCVFDPSPVTGWSSVDKVTRERNARGLQTARLFEHGEALAYIRLVLSYVYPPPAVNPAVREIRVNFDPRLWVIANHDMKTLSDGLSRHARPPASR